LKVIAKTIYLLTFYSGLSMNPGTVWIFSGLRSRVTYWPTILLESRTKNYHKSIDTFCFIALTKSVTQIKRGVTERHCLSKGILSQQESSTKLL